MFDCTSVTCDYYIDLFIVVFTGHAGSFST